MAIDAVFLAEHLRDVTGDCVDDSGQVRLVQAVAVGPLGDCVRIEQRIRTDLGLVALNVFFDGIGITRHLDLLLLNRVDHAPPVSEGG